MKAQEISVILRILEKEVGDCILHSDLLQHSAHGAVMELVDQIQNKIEVAANGIDNGFDIVRVRAKNAALTSNTI